jgi:hypothetical protein
MTTSAVNCSTISHKRSLEPALSVSWEGAGNCCLPLLTSHLHSDKSFLEPALSVEIFSNSNGSDGKWQAKRAPEKKDLEVLAEAALSCTHASSPIFQRERHVHAGLPKVLQFAVW